MAASESSARAVQVLVVGGGHAGCEAALASARRGFSTLLVTGSIDRIAAMSCNPAVGGVGKTHLVKELDALGGYMAQIADATGIQFRTLNASRGPAVRATRCQSDMNRYREAMTDIVLTAPNLRVRQDDVVGIQVEDGRCIGVQTRHSGFIAADRVVLTTGTFLGGQLHLGNHQTPGGRAGESPMRGLSASLMNHGLRLGRLKTGTCPRLDIRTIDLNRLTEQPPDDPAPRFAFDSGPPPLPQVSCYHTRTTGETHRIIADAVERGL
ncbi:MAG: FAD-dependent oxidoreductase, partial [Myxococcota bacterium]